MGLTRLSSLFNNSDCLSPFSSGEELGVDEVGLVEGLGSEGDVQIPVGERMLTSFSWFSNTWSFGVAGSSAILEGKRVF